jgi:PAS domain S-box-containing protein
MAIKTLQPNCDVAPRMSPPNPSESARRLWPPSPRLLGYAVSVLVVGLAVVYTVHEQPLMQGNLLLLCLAAVTVSAWYGGVGPGLLAACLAIAATYFLFAPVDHAQSDIGTLLADRLRPLLFASVSLLISALSQAKRNSEAELARTLQELERRVDERTQALSAANHALEAQVVERRRAEEAYRELFENASDMVYTLDLEGRFTSLNKAGERLLGYSSDESRQLRFEGLVAPHDASAVRDLVTGLADGGSSTALTLDLLARDGRRVPIETTLRLICREGQPVGIQGIARDFTERDRLEGELRQAHKLEAIGRLAGGVAHDFNNILMVIQGYGDMLLSRVGRDNPLYNDLSEIPKAARRGSALTRQLLAFGRKQMLWITPLDLNTVVRDTTQMLVRLIGENIRLRLHLEETPCPIEADRMQLEQVLVNLAVNARDAMPVAGDLTIDVAAVHLHSLDHALPPGSYIRLSIRDTGCGMDDATKARLFEPFFTTKAPGHGSGLGLATVYGIVKQLGGHIDVDTAPLQGTTFVVHFPRTDKAVAVAAETVVVESSAVGTETILLVEDDDSVRAFSQAVLKRQGYVILEATGPKEALTIAARHPGTIDLVLTDVIMPDMTGPEMVTLLKGIRPEPHVLYISGYATDALVGDGVLSEQVVLVQKPVAARDLLRAVRLVLDTPMPPPAGAAGLQPASPV